MFCTFTNSYTKDQFSLNVNLILVVERPKDSLFMRVITSMMGQKGPVAYEVMENHQEIIAEIQRALGYGGQSPSLPSKPAALIAS